MSFLLGIASYPEADICIIDSILILFLFTSEEVARDTLLGAGLLCITLPILEGVKLLTL